MVAGHCPAEAAVCQTQCPSAGCADTLWSPVPSVSHFCLLKMAGEATKETFVLLYLSNLSCFSPRVSHWKHDFGRPAQCLQGGSVLLSARVQRLWMDSKPLLTILMEGFWISFYSSSVASVRLDRQIYVGISGYMLISIVAQAVRASWLEQFMSNLNYVKLGAWGSVSSIYEVHVGYQFLILSFGSRLHPSVGLCSQQGCG